MSDETTMTALHRCLIGDVWADPGDTVVLNNATRAVYVVRQTEGSERLSALLAEGLLIERHIAGGTAGPAAPTARLRLVR